MNTKLFKQSTLGSLLGLLLLSLLASCAGSRHAFTETGKASYYADKFNGRPTASGETYRPGKMTAAHKAKVVVNDRGPHVAGRIVDLSRKAARQVDMLDDGVVPCTLRVLKPAPAGK